jgi:hypothetical protein
VYLPLVRTSSHVGSMQYKQTLPLNDHEVVITFDESPLPPYTNIILKILASQCVQANYFFIGQIDHPIALKRLSLPKVEHEVDGGIAAVEAAIGGPKAVAPFFRIPSLARSDALDKFLASHSLITWSTDVVADDWFRRITPQQIVQRAIERLDANGRGILLLHDIHPEHGYHVVHVVPTSEMPKSVPELPAPPAAVANGEWPRVLKTGETTTGIPSVKSHGVKKRLSPFFSRTPPSSISFLTKRGLVNWTGETKRRNSSIAKLARFQSSSSQSRKVGALVSS